MKRRLLHIGFTCLLLCTCNAILAQVSARASVNRDKILIGEPIQLTLQGYGPLGEEMTWFALDTIARFEFISKAKIDTVESVDGKKMQQIVTITSFDSGSVTIPPLALVMGNQTYFTDSIPIEVSYSNPFNPQDEYKDIKEIEEVFNPLAKYIPWIITALSVLSVGGVAWFIRRKKLAPVEKKQVFSKLSPIDEAMQALDKLKKKDTPTTLEAKNYYTELNDILRVFVLRKVNIASLEKTNEELIVQLREFIPNRDSFSHLAQALRMSDFVKFAKFLPAKEDNEKNLETIRAAIKTINTKE